MRGERRGSPRGEGASSVASTGQSPKTEFMMLLTFGSIIVTTMEMMIIVQQKNLRCNFVENENDDTNDNI